MWLPVLQLFNYNHYFYLYNLFFISLQSIVESSSDESEEDVPVIKQLMTEIGVKEEVSDEEESDDDHSDDSGQDERAEPDVNEGEDIGSGSSDDSEEDEEEEEELDDSDNSDVDERSETNATEDESEKLPKQSAEGKVSMKDSVEPLESGKMSLHYFQYFFIYLIINVET